MNCGGAWWNNECSYSGLEYLYDVLLDTEYEEAVKRPQLRSRISGVTESENASATADLQLRVSLIRPYIPDHLHQLYRQYAAFVGRLQMKAIRQRESSIFVSWTELDDGSPDSYLAQLATPLISPSELRGLWTGRSTAMGISRPLRPVIDAAEQALLEVINRVLNGLA